MTDDFEPIVVDSTIGPFTIILQEEEDDLRFPVILGPDVEFHGEPVKLGLAIESDHPEDTYAARRFRVGDVIRLRGGSAHAIEADIMLQYGEVDEAYVIFKDPRTRMVVAESSDLDRTALEFAQSFLSSNPGILDRLNTALGQAESLELGTRAGRLRMKISDLEQEAEILEREAEHAAPGFGR